ncbi:hypothetical protein VMCG_05139 [Cytospora schulzeri]|uniref:Aminoglycoside phosphotransferase domain-containing protein n=1 Tax=Cytospora schulzeri TaxID=448051 RepID=A0A423WQS8_9PEZI|nr:hypothetical protein VMCG_05139 [Valsa malicola]
MNINQEGYDRRLAVVQGILHQFRLTSTEVTPLAYVEHCPFHFNNFIYKVVLDSPMFPASFPEDQPGTSKPPPEGVSSLVIRLSNPRAEGLNNANRVENEVASLYLARQSLQNSGSSPVVPAVYAWSPCKFHDVPHEEGFGWIMAEFKSGSDLDAQFPNLSVEERNAVVEQIAVVLSAIQRVTIPEGATEFGALTFVDGKIVSGQMPLLKGGPWRSYSALWAAKLQAQLEDSENSPLLKGWRTENIRERLDRFLANGVDKVLDEIDVTQRVLVHGDLTMNNMLYDNSTKLITAVLDFDWSSITHPADEFLTGLWDIGGGIHEENEFMQDYILTGNFDNAPPGLSGEDVQKWEVAKTWDNALAQRKAMRPCGIKGVRGIQELRSLESIICPFHLSNEVMLKRMSEDVQAEKKVELGEDIKKWLDVHGF